MKPKREPFSGWWRAAVLCAVPCSLLFSEVWMNVHIIDHAYERGRLTREVREARERTQGLKQELAELEAIQKMADAAPDLGLVEAEYDQIRVIRGSVAPANDSDKAEYAAAESPIQPLSEVPSGR